ncbi:myosin heavy subunit [Staphylococcus saprophyticus]|uniref:GA module-containing protein n=3 Tax=Staphylococcus TaxID=1279 RepID=UPI00085369D5|nr:MULTISPECIES: GA module-containing protein [Staphylococcus]MBN6756755.1 GA module-containing protein [Staphylococcus saprophyticus]MBN6766765.1 GA module-containing protein [Staphylococcus saprophyticus]MBN6771540.1 GA module-containing protein [Staphylococcus saprophyticus]MBN6781350.1 GA module-containing protein [Staphylococcus saprophyticus]MBN6788515.1 GA module-containing protein [Staphylococcus saprophyticus]
MKKLRYNNLSNKTRLNHQFKFSTMALIISTSLMGYSMTSTPSVEAKDKADLNIETHSNSENTLEQRIQEGKEKIDKLKNIKDSQKDASIKEITKAKSTEEVEAILKKAKKVDNKIIEQNRVQSHLIENDKKEVSEDKKSVKSELDSKKNIVSSVKEKSNHIEEQDSIDLFDQEDLQDNTFDANLNQRDTKQDISHLVDMGKLNEESKDIADMNDSEENKNTASEKDEGAVKENNQDGLAFKDTSNTKSNQMQQSDEIKKDIDKVTTNHSKVKDNLDYYVENKENNLKILDSKLSERDSISAKNKEKLKKEIEKTQQSLKKQNDVVLNHLQSVNNKEQAVKDIVSGTFDEKSAQSILERIDTKGKTDQQIASQVVSELDNLSTTTSDDILKSMFDKTSDKQELIKTILLTKFDHIDTSKIVDEIMHKNPSNEQIVALIKHHFGDNVTSDDILENILDQSHDKRKALETMLATKLNDAKAKALADVIAKKEDSKHNLLNLMKSGINNELNDLLKADKDISKFKDDMHGLFEPLKYTPSLSNKFDGSLLDRAEQMRKLSGNSKLLGTPSLFDDLFNRNSILDGIKDISNPSPGRALSLGDSSGSFLSGLFDNNGDFSLPDTGTVVKKSTIPLGILLFIIGGGLIWFIKRNKSKNCKY